MSHTPNSHERFVCQPTPVRPTRSLYSSRSRNQGKIHWRSLRWIEATALPLACRRRGSRSSIPAASETRPSAVCTHAPLQPPCLLTYTCGPGSGYYADDEVGGCVATGDGDKIMRYCMCIQVVNLLSTGLHPNDACAAVIRSTAKRSPQDIPWVALAAVDRLGRVGASCSFPTWPDQITGIVYPGFPYAVWKDGESAIHVAPCALDNSE